MRKIVFSVWFEAGAEVAITPQGLSVTKPGKFAKMVDAVEDGTFSGRRGRETGQDVIYVTERAVLRSTGEGLAAVEVMPGIEPARDIVAPSGGRVRIAPDARPMPLSLLADGPIGLAL